jgi:hypothetical protein
VNAWRLTSPDESPLQCSRVHADAYAGAAAQRPIPGAQGSGRLFEVAFDQSAVPETSMGDYAGALASAWDAILLKGVRDWPTQR